ncbi:MAG: hypothetical protein V7711_01290 [Pseudomonadales bacterium]
MAGNEISTFPRFVSSTLLMVAFFSIFQAGSILLADLSFSDAKTEVGFWSSKSYQPTTLSKKNAQSNIQAAIAQWPQNPEYLSLQAHAHNWQAFWAVDEEVQVAEGHLAIRSQQQAQISRPAYKAGWAALQDYKARMGEYDDIWRQAREHKARLGERK